MGSKLTQAWQDWIVENLSRGCSPESMLASMTASGFEAIYAQAALDVTRTLLGRVAPMLEQMSQEVPKPRLQLADANQQQLLPDDHPVRLAFSYHQPRIAVYDDFLSASECEGMIALALPRMRRSTVVDRNTGEFVEAGVRRSDGTHFQGVSDPLITRVEQRIEALTGIPAPNGESLQVLRYMPGGEYLPHHDYFDPEEPGHEGILQRGGQRIATLIMYLSDVPHGGGTGFPELGIVVRPQRGRAVYFEYCTDDGKTDSRLLHAGLPVLSGEKWIATRWMRQRAFI